MFILSIYDDNPYGIGNDSVVVNNNSQEQEKEDKEEEVINPVTHPELEVFECVKCSHPNVLKKTPRRRRQTRVRHFRLDDLTYASFVRYCQINCVDRNYGLLLLLMHAKTQNIDYIINPLASTLSLPKNKPKRGKQKKRVK